MDKLKQVTQNMYRNFIDDISLDREGQKKKLEKRRIAVLVNLLLHFRIFVEEGGTEITVDNVASLIEQCDSVYLVYDGNTIELDVIPYDNQKMYLGEELFKRGDKIRPKRAVFHQGEATLSLSYGMFDILFLISYTNTFESLVK